MRKAILAALLLTLVGCSGEASRQTPELSSIEAPQYPSEAQELGQVGTVQVHVLVDRSGKVAEAKIGSSSGYDLLDQEALRVARMAKFKPAVMDGEKVAVWCSLPVKFSLSEIETHNPSSNS